MPGETKHGIECTEFEALVSDAVEGKLSPARKQSFEAHSRVCEICGPMLADVKAGQQWLHSLALEPVEPPVHMVHNILAATSGVLSTRSEAVTSGGNTPFMERMRERWDSFFTPITGFIRQPRFVMSFGMIFFSFSLALNAAGVKPSDVAKVDLRPSALRHAYNDAEIKVVKYYDNIRFVYEIESKLRELKRSTTPSESAPEAQPENRKDRENRKNNDTSGQPDQKQDRNYSKEYDQPVLAALRNASPAVTVTTNRRFV
jgi:Putative zinc-finger